MQLIDGKATAAAIKAEIAEEVKEIVAAGGKQPHLAAVLVGHDGGSETYVKNKVLACEACGFKSTLIRFEDDITEEELLACVDKLNKDDDVDGFIVQLPLPKHIDEQKIIAKRADMEARKPMAFLQMVGDCGSQIASALSEDLRYQMLSMLALIVKSDANVTDTEVEALKEVAIYIGLKVTDVDTLMHLDAQKTQDAKDEWQWIKQN